MICFLCYHICMLMPYGYVTDKESFRITWDKFLRKHKGDSIAKNSTSNRQRQQTAFRLFGKCEKKDYAGKVCFILIGVVIEVKLKEGHFHDF
jgi:hypothetical protein